MSEASQAKVSWSIAAAKKVLAHTPAYEPLRSAIEAIRIRSRLRAWASQGYPVPPPDEVKHATIKDYAKRYRMDTLVETGTLHGSTIAATKRVFNAVYSIELSPELYERARERFAGDSKVHLLPGDSGVVLRTVLPIIPEKKLFWLDGHYSGEGTARAAIDTPILQELAAVVELCPNSIVLIDDARLFDGTNSYPTLTELADYLHEKAPHWTIEVKYDIIRAVPDPAFSENQ